MINMKFEKLKAGMELYDVRRATGMAVFRGSKYNVWPVHILEINVTNRKALVSWNYNAARWIPERQVTKYRFNKPKSP
jgi:hypothetical protein